MLACVRAYNDWLVEWCEADSRRFIPVMATPFWDVDAAVDEVRRGAELGHKAVLFTGEPQRMGAPLLGDPAWDPFWSVIEEVGLPVSLHIGSADFFTSDFSWDRIKTLGVGATNTKTAITLFMKNGIQVADFLLSGVLARHPDLQVVSVESGVGWVPFLLEAADYAFEYSDVRRSGPSSSYCPASTSTGRGTGCWFFERLALQRMLDVIGEDRLLFETDYPHPVCLYGDVRERIDTALGDLPRDPTPSPLDQRRRPLRRRGARRPQPVLDVGAFRHSPTSRTTGYQPHLVLGGVEVGHRALDRASLVQKTKRHSLHVAAGRCRSSARWPRPGGGTRSSLASTAASLGTSSVL